MSAEEQSDYSDASWKENATQAFEMAVNTTINAKVVEDDNASLREELRKNMERLREIEDALPRSKILQQQIKEKEAELAEKQKNLIDLQAAIIATLKAPRDTSLQAIPPVMNMIQKFVTDLTENAMRERTLAIPVIQVLRVVDQINAVYDKLVETNTIEETADERAEREEMAHKKREAIQTLLEVVQAQAQAQEQEQEEEPEQPKVEEQAPQAQEAAAPAAAAPDRPPTPEPSAVPEPAAPPAESPVAEAATEGEQK